MNEYILKYSHDSNLWEEALPLGNGRIGAMIFGRANQEILRLNEETLWEGYEHDWDNPALAEHLDEIRGLIFKGDFDNADTLLRECIRPLDDGEYACGPGNPYGTYRAAGDIMIETQDNSPTTLRTLDILHGVAQTETANYTRTHFISHATNTFVNKIKATSDKLNLSIRYDNNIIGDNSDINIAMEGCDHGAEDFAGFRIKKDFSVICPNIHTDNGYITFDEQLEGKNALSWAFCARIITDGTLSPLADGYSVTDATDVVIIASIHTTYNTPSPITQVKENVDKAVELGYDALFANHKTHFEEMMSRSTLSLESDAELQKLDTDTRLKRLIDGKTDIGFAELYFNFGKYLLISSSSPESTLPGNLQGIWAKDNTPPWSADFHSNINVQMNYWPAEVTGLGDCAIPLFRFTKFLSKYGAKSAKTLYNCSGWTLHYTSTPWGYTSTGAHPNFGCFALGGVWCCNHIFAHYSVTKDKAFLEEYWPTLKGSAEFLLDFFVKDPNTGYMVSCPAASPENTFRSPESGKEVSACAGTAIDNELAQHFLEYFTEYAPVVNEDADFIAKAQNLLDNLAPITVGKNGNIQEWQYDFDEVDVGHRHISHLYGLYPAALFDKDKTPHLYEAAKKTIERRLSAGGGHTGWSRAWIINFFARLHDSENAKHNLDQLFSKSTLPNLFDNHPPFQIDGNFGGCAAIAEMLLNTVTGELLPALPKEWTNGSVKGFKTMDGRTFSFTWKNGAITSKTVD